MSGGDAKVGNHSRLQPTTRSFVTVSCALGCLAPPASQSRACSGPRCDAAQRTLIFHFLSRHTNRGTVSTETEIDIRSRQNISQLSASSTSKFLLSQWTRSRPTHKFAITAGTFKKQETYLASEPGSESGAGEFLDLLRKKFCRVTGLTHAWFGGPGESSPGKQASIALAFTLRHPVSRIVGLCPKKTSRAGLPECF